MILRNGKTMNLRSENPIQKEVVSDLNLINPLSLDINHTSDIKYIYVVISPGISRYPEEVIGGVCFYDNKGVEHLRVLYLNISKFGTYLNCLNAIEQLMQSQLAGKEMLVLVESVSYDYIAIKNEVDYFYTKHHIRNGKVHNCRPSIMVCRSAERQYEKHKEKIEISADATIQAPPGKDPTHCDPFKMQALLFDNEYEKFITYKQ